MATLTLQPSNGVDTHAFDYSGYQALNYGTQTEMPLGHQHLFGENINCYGFFRFDLSSLPVGSDLVESATFTLYRSSGGEIAPPYNTFTAKLLSRTNWTEGGLTWLRYDGTNLWTTAGGDVLTGYDAAANHTGADTSLAITGMATLVRRALDLGRTTLDFRVQGLANIPELPDYNDYANFYTSDHSTAGERPKLEIVYSLPGYFMAKGQAFAAGLGAGRGQLMPL